MGLGVFVQGSIAGRGLFRRRPGRDKLFADIRSAIEGMVDDDVMNRFLQTDISQHMLSVILHPCAEPLELLWKPDQTIQASAKTSTVGPGYHAFVVDLLKGIGSSANIDWDWTAEAADETDYARTGVLTGAQAQMAGLLQALFRRMLEMAEQEGSSLMVNMPLGFPSPQLDAFIVTPVGPVSEEFCRSVVQAGEAELAERCREFFIWWDRDADARFWRSTGLAMLWCDVSWHAPKTDEQRHICQLALACFDKASQADPQLDLPQAELAELRRLIEADPSAAQGPPAAKAVGYHRLPMRHTGTGNWSVVAPGYFYEQVEDDGSQLCWWFGEKTIWQSSMNVGGKNGEVAKARDILPEKTAERVGDREVVDFEYEHLVGWAAIGPAEENGEVYLQLQGTVASDNSICIVTICFKNSTDKDWAIETFRSIRHPKPDE